jgi:tetratricopeptide (TPR) repeat protein
LSDKATRKELKKPDSFQKVGGEARDWVAERQKLVATGVAVLLAVGLIIGLSTYFMGRGKVQEAGVFGETLRVLMRPVEGHPEAFRQQGNTPFKTQREKDEAVRSAVTEFRTKHQGTSASQAQLALAHAELHLGNADAALINFDEFLGAAPPNDLLRFTALEGKGIALETKGDLEKALLAFDELSLQNKTEFLAGMGQYHRGRILTLQNKKPDAAKAFVEIQSAFPNTAAARLSADRLGLLVAEGVTPPSPAGAPTAAPDAR